MRMARKHEESDSAKPLKIDLSQLYDGKSTAVKGEFKMNQKSSWLQQNSLAYALDGTSLALIGL